MGRHPPPRLRHRLTQRPRRPPGSHRADALTTLAAQSAAPAVAHRAAAAVVTAAVSIASSAASFTADAASGRLPTPHLFDASSIRAACSTTLLRWCDLEREVRPFDPPPRCDSMLSSCTSRTHQLGSLAPLLSLCTKGTV